MSDHPSVRVIDKRSSTPELMRVYDRWVNLMDIAANSIENVLAIRADNGDQRAARWVARRAHARAATQAGR